MTFNDRLLRIFIPVAAISMGLGALFVMVAMIIYEVRSITEYF